MPRVLGSGSLRLCHCEEASDEAIWDYETAVKVDGRDCFVGSLLAMTQSVTRYDLLFATGTRHHLGFRRESVSVLRITRLMHTGKNTIPRMMDKDGYASGSD